MDVFLVNTESDLESGGENCAQTLMLKLANSKDKAVIPLTDAEMQLYRSDDFQILRLDSSSPDLSFKATKGERHIFVVDPKEVNINDIAKTCDLMGIEYGIIRKTSR